MKKNWTGRIYLSALLLLMAVPSTAQESTDRQAATELARTEKNKELRQKKTSPLKPADRKKFHDLGYFPYDNQWVVKAAFEVAPTEEIVEIPTSAGTTKKFQKYGRFMFTIDGRIDTLWAFKRIWPEGSAHADDHQTLFVPFTDLTSGTSTYGGGRYLDLEIPENGELMMIDFNQCYSPYCAYGRGFSCPIPPSENFLNSAVNAGEKAYDQGH